MLVGSPDQNKSTAELKVTHLPRIEQAARDSIDKETSKQILHSQGVDLEFNTVSSQLGGMNYAAHLAEVARGYRRVPPRGWRRSPSRPRDGCRTRAGHRRRCPRTGHAQKRAEPLHVLGQDGFVTEVTRHLGEAGQEFVHGPRRARRPGALLKIPREAHLDHRSARLTRSVTVEE